jgi:Na+-driven multidrug efflux pump
MIRESPPSKEKKRVATGLVVPLLLPPELLSLPRNEPLSEDHLKLITSLTHHIPISSISHNRSVLWTIFVQGIWMSLSDISLLIFPCLPFLLARVNNDPVHVAATATILTLLDFMVLIGSSPVFILNTEVALHLGKLNFLENRCCLLQLSELPSDINSLPLVGACSSAYIITENNNLLHFFRKKTDIQSYPNSQDITEERFSIAQLFQNAIIIVACISPFIMLPLLFAEPLLHDVFGQSEDVAEATQEFTFYYAFFIFPTLCYATAAQILNCFEFITAMQIGFCNFIICTVIAGVLSANSGNDIPELGLTGILIGYGLLAFSTAFIYGGFLFCHSEFNRFEFGRTLFGKRVNPSKLKALAIGTILMALTVGSEVVTNFVLTIIAGLISIHAQDVLALILQYVAFNLILCANFGLAVSILLGKAFTEQRHAEAYSLSLKGIFLSWCVCSIIPIYFAISPETLLYIFGVDDHDMYRDLVRLTPIFSVAASLDSLCYNFVMQIRTFDHSTDLLASTFLRVGSLFAGLLISAMLGLMTPMGIDGIALGYVVGMFSGCVGLGYYWWVRMKPYRDSSLQENVKPKCELQFVGDCSEKGDMSGNSYCNFWKSKDLSLSESSSAESPFSHLHATQNVH